jgi:4-hydroxyacetophenone monooxygenase
MTKPLAPADQAITENDAFIERALEHASIPTLMMSMIHMSGDSSLLEGAIRPGSAVLGDTTGGMSREDKEEVRRAALAIVRDYRDRGCELPPPPSPEQIHRMMRFMVGQDVPDEYVPMMLEEMALDGADARDTQLADAVPDAVKQGFSVVVIGAGMSGILTAIRLQDAGIPYTVIEKNPSVGGTWYENTYPGCRVDIANHFYSYSFEPNHGWSHFYSEQPELRTYFEDCVDKYGVREHIRFSSEVASAEFDEAGRCWLVRVRGPKGAEETLRASVVISAVGQLNRPMIPPIEGLDSFTGPVFHSAEWDHSVDLTGKRVAVIGTGASALQLVPEVAERAEQLYVVQRSPAWMFPNPSYHSEVSPETQWLLEHLPYYARWYRFLIFWPGSDGLLPSLVVDPDWPHPDRSINALNESTRVFFTDYMKSQLEDRPDLLEQVVPKYPPFGKRMLQDNGSWLATLKRDDVELITGGVSKITSSSIVVDSGAEREVDVIVFATGFHANKFLWPMEIVGQGGVRLGELWGDDPQAYLGITVPRFPNFFCLYGPATNLAHAGSIIFNSECQVRYIMGCIDALLRGEHRTMDCRQDVHDAFNRKLEETLAGMVWSHPGMDSWYKNSRGKVTTTSPWRLLDYWRWTREPDLSDYELR